MNITDGGPAFPFKCHGPTTAPEVYYGMSLRDYFAGQALAGFCAAPSLADTTSDDIAGWCVETADALIAKLVEGGAE